MNYLPTSEFIAWFEREIQDTPILATITPEPSRHIDPMQARVMAQLNDDDRVEYARLYCADMSQPKWKPRTDCGNVEQTDPSRSLGIIALTCFVLGLLVAWGGR